MAAPPAIRRIHSDAASEEGPATGTPRRSRRYPRFDVSWPVVVEAGRRFFLLQTVNVSGRGAGVRPTERLGEGSVAHLHFHPPNGPAFDVHAIVWRVDPDGLAFHFIDDNQSRLTALLARLPKTAPALWTSALN